MPFLAALTIELHFASNRSLKGKRKELSAVRAALERKFGASVAEVDHQDLWQRATLVASIVGRSSAELNRVVDGIICYLDGRFTEGARVERRIVSFGDLDA